jgi:DNA-binding GntR family transcriptional regulator
MSPAHVLEPTYEALKLRLKTGRWPSGSRLEAAKLADELSVSMTPVRDSLWRLAGEHLVDATPGEGFRVPRIGAHEIRDLLELNCILLLAALAAAPAAPQRTPEIAGDPAERTARAFLFLADRASNDALVGTVAAINDRLHLVRRFDPDLMPDSEKMLMAIERAAYEGGEAGTIRDLLLRYHHARATAADQYARLIALPET